MRKILKGNLDCIGCPNYHVTKNGKVYSNYKGKGWVKLSLNRIKNNGYVIVSIRDTNGYRYTYNIHQLVATGMIKAKLARKYEISPMLVYKYIKKRKRYEKDFERTHGMEG